MSRGPTQAAEHMNAAVAMTRTGSMVSRGVTFAAKFLYIMQLTVVHSSATSTDFSYNMQGILYWLALET